MRDLVELSLKNITLYTFRAILLGVKNQSKVVYSPFWRPCINPLCSTQSYSKRNKGEGPVALRWEHELTASELMLHRKAYAEIPRKKWRLPSNDVDKGGVYHCFCRRLPVIARVLLLFGFSSTFFRAPALRSSSFAFQLFAVQSSSILHFSSYVVFWYCCLAAVTVVRRGIERLRFVDRARCRETGKDEILVLYRAVRCTEWD